MFDLKNFRESSLKMTQQEFANLINMEQGQISRFEKNPGQISLNDLTIIANKTGMTLDSLVNFKKLSIEALDTAFKWQTAAFTKNTLVDYIEKEMLKDRQFDEHKTLIVDLKDGVKRAIKKPKITIIGRSDTGKSTMINAIIGTEKMPVSWTPTTSIIVYVKHLSDKPDFIAEDVWVFKASKDGKYWDDSFLENKTYCQEWKLAAGGYELLKTYATRKDDDCTTADAGAAVVFVDSDVLKNCDFIDLPGFGTGDRKEDDLMSLNASQRADVLIYLSIANGFMREDDIQYLHHAIKNLSIIESKEDEFIPPLSNLFIVASQAHTVSSGDENSLKTILDKGCERFLKTVTEDFWKDREEITGYTYTYNIFRSRFFTYSLDIKETRSAFEEKLKRIIEILPGQIEYKAKKFVKEYAESAGISLDKYINNYNKMLGEKNKYENLFNEIKKFESLRVSNNEAEKINISKKLDEFRKESVTEFSRKYGAIISADNIARIIKEKDFKKNKEDVKLLSNHVSSLVEDAYQTILKKKSEDLGEIINNYINVFQQSALGEKAEKLGINSIPFDATRAFATGLTGLVTIGGLAFWASTLGNLGAYILLAKGVSLLAAIGISVGGTAAAASAIAAIGGPVVLGIALAVLTALAVFAVFSGGWEMRLAKKLVNAYDEQNALFKYKKAINSFWEDTQYAFDKASEKMEEEWKNYVDNLRNMIENYDIDDIKKRINIASEIKDFFLNIPL